MCHFRIVDNVVDLVVVSVPSKTPMISATTTELNNIFVNSIPQPITTTATGQQMSLTAIVNADAGSTLQFFILDESGNMTLAVGSAVFGNTAGTMTWQLLAQGPVGNIGTV